MFRAWCAITLWKRVIIGLVFGLVVGLGLRYVIPLPEFTLSQSDAETTLSETTLSGAQYIGQYWIYPFGQAFVRLIKMLIIPLILTTLVSGVTAMGDPKKLGSLGLRTLALYLGTTFFAVIYLGLVALFAAQACGIPVTFSQYVMVAMLATLVSIGAAGIPSAGLLLAASVIEVIGASPEQSIMVIAFIFPFDRILDMMRTMTNVTGGLAVACTVAKWQGSLDENVFRTEAEV